MTTITHMAMGYRATRTDDALTVHRVPIFCACERGEVQFDDVWIASAVSKAKQNEREGYYPPLHIRHHEASTEANDSVRAAGYFCILGAEPITFKGARRTAILADLVITDPVTQKEVLAKRLPYRSVEIFDVDDPAIDGLALLDHEAPFLELPMLMVSEVDERAATTKLGGAVADATFRRPWSMDARTNDEPVLACFRKGAAAHLLFREGTMAEDKTTDELIATETADATRTAQFAENGDDPKDKEYKAKDDDDNGEEMQEVLDVAGVVKAIESGEISVADMDAILTAIQSQTAESAPEEEEPAPAVTPGVEAMRRGNSLSARFASIAGENEALKARLDARDASDQRTSDVAAAMKRLEGRPLGADLETRMVTFHKSHGGEAFKDYVDSMAKTAGVWPDDEDGRGETFNAQLGKVPAVAMQYQDKGTGAVDQATRYSREWETLRGSGLRTSEERYVALNMAKDSGAES